MKIVKIEPKIETKWLAFNSATYINKEGKEMKWDYVSRKNNSKVITVICRSKSSGKYLLISQPRVPINKIVVEFPAGLIDPNETIEKAGLRELKEETGYDAEVISTAPFLIKSAGLSDETTAVIECIVDEKAVGKTEMESTEDIQSFWMTPEEFMNMVEKMDKNTTIVDTLTWFYFQGVLSQTKKAKKSTKKN